MAQCAYCGTTIVFGGVRDGDLKFCNEKCHQNGYMLMLSREIPREIVDRQIMEVHQGLCPKCHGMGPVDVHTSYRIYSLVFMSSWSSIPTVCCRSCGRKSQIGYAVFSFLFGWWGFPWGVIMTPVQIARNIMGVFGGPDATRPSANLETIVRIAIAAEYRTESQKNAT